MPDVSQRSTLKKIASFSFTQEDILAYRDFSMDLNPIHLEGVVFGIQLMATIENHLLNYLRYPIFNNLSYYYLDKVYANDTIDLYLDEYSHDFTVCSLDKTIGKGKISIE